MSSVVSTAAIEVDIRQARASVRHPEPVAPALSNITPKRVRVSLRALRHAEPITSAVLLGLEQVEARRRWAGLAPTKEAREWALGMILAEAVGSELLRFPISSPYRDLMPCARARRQLAEHCASADPARQSWAILQYRYFTACEEPSATAAGITGLSTRTLRRRIDWGVGELAARLRAAERGMAA